MSCALKISFHKKTDDESFRSALLKREADHLNDLNFKENIAMRKIVAGFAASVDGYIEGPNAEYDWIIIDKEVDFAEQMKPFDTFLFGRRTYKASLKMMGKPAPGITNYVFSRSLKTVHENFQLVRGELKEEVLRIKEQEGKDIAVFGGASLLASLLDLRLVDEIAFLLYPCCLVRVGPWWMCCRKRFGSHYPVPGLMAMEPYRFFILSVTIANSFFSLVLLTCLYILRGSISERGDITK